jgi:thiol-disulfide isomerase/thioredoxin
MHLGTSSFRPLAAALLVLAALAGPARAFEVTDTQGKVHRLADYRGRWVVVNFWATWCVPCIQEIPEIAAFAHERRDVAVLGVAVDAEDAGKVKAFATRVGHDYPLVLSNEKVEKQLGDPRALPVTRIYDPQGKLDYDRVGRVDRRFLDRSTPPQPRA